MFFVPRFGTKHNAIQSAEPLYRSCPLFDPALLDDLRLGKCWSLAHPITSRRQQLAPFSLLRPENNPPPCLPDNGIKLPSTMYTRLPPSPSRHAIAFTASTARSRVKISETTASSHKLRQLALTFADVALRPPQPTILLIKSSSALSGLSRNSNKAKNHHSLPLPHQPGKNIKSRHESRCVPSVHSSDYTASTAEPANLTLASTRPPLTKQLSSQVTCARARHSTLPYRASLRRKALQGVCTVHRRSSGRDMVLARNDWSLGEIRYFEISGLKRKRRGNQLSISEE
ncbi:hypothetical protein GALMADRAFT_147144 [Galerina marginata CBS 339.88]|uniref:Uncharacterized protein n=1 Tax=Galerina marginata (strain CBS 339.88) TaxID=685588 RepID=A0A067SKP1_GALM3|nr:hypothetical protein GALMADRAFT_147144 [Galerina marginata CBS 339.88]